jgi:hypothetical protein
MVGLLCFVLAILALPFKSRHRLEAENAVLRHQLNILRRKVPGPVRLSNGDRWFMVQLYRCFHRFCRLLRSSDRRRWSVGIGLAFAAIGVGSRVLTLCNVAFPG